MYQTLLPKEKVEVVMGSRRSTLTLNQLEIVVRYVAVTEVVILFADELVFFGELLGLLILVPLNRLGDSHAEYLAALARSTGSVIGVCNFGIRLRCSRGLPHFLFGGRVRRATDDLVGDVVSESGFHPTSKLIDAVLPGGTIDLAYCGTVRRYWPGIDLVAATVIAKTVSAPLARSQPAPTGPFGFVVLISLGFLGTVAEVGRRKLDGGSHGREGNFGERDWRLRQVEGHDRSRGSAPRTEYLLTCRCYGG